MILHAFRRLVGLAILFAVLSTVLSHWGPGLAAKSMGGYVRQLDAAEAGNYAQADRIGTDLAREWDGMRVQVLRLVHEVQDAIDGIVPTRLG